MSRLRLLSALIALLVAATACEVTADVAIQVDPDGSGVVTVTLLLDDEALGRIGDPDAVIRVDDLRAAGWTVGDAIAGDGAWRRSVVREFGSPDQLAVVLEEVGGRDGVFRDVSLELTDGFGDVTYDFSADVELSGSPEQFGDAFLAASLGGPVLGRDAEQLAAEGGDDPTAMTLAVHVALPGGVPETDGQLVDGAASWRFPITGGEPTSATLRTSATTASTRLTLLVGLGVVSLVAAIVVAGVGLRRRGD